MKAKFESLRIEQIVLHEVRRFKGDTGDDIPTPILAKKESALETPERKFLEGRIRESAAGYKVAAIRPSAHEVAQRNLNPGRVVALLKKPKDLVATSQAMVRDLVAAQGRIRGADYLLAMGTGTCGAIRILFVFTMTIETGMRANFKDADAPTLEEVKDLVLDKGATLDKLIALELDGNDATGIVEDSLVGNADAAQYFLTSFLGYETTDNARKQTQAFYAAVKSLINKQVTEQDIKLRLTRALVSEVQSQADSISISEFRKRHVPPKYQPAFDAAIEKQGLPKGKIGLDATNLRSQRNQTTLEMSNGARLTIPAGLTQDFLEAGHDEKGEFVKIRARIEKLT